MINRFFACLQIILFIKLSDNICKFYQHTSALFEWKLPHSFPYPQFIKMSESFHNVISPVLRISQFFGLMPVNLDTDDPMKIDFAWKSGKTVYCIIFLFCGTIEAGLSLRIAIKKGLELSGSSGFTYLLVSTLGGFLMLNLARKWPRLIAKWWKSEEIFVTQSCYQFDGLSLKTKI